MFLESINQIKDEITQDINRFVDSIREGDTAHKITGAQKAKPYSKKLKTGKAIYPSGTPSKVATQTNENIESKVDSYIDSLDEDIRSGLKAIGKGALETGKGLYQVGKRVVKGTAKGAWEVGKGVGRGVKTAYSTIRNDEQKQKQANLEVNRKKASLRQQLIDAVKNRRKTEEDKVETARESPQRTAPKPKLTIPSVTQQKRIINPDQAKRMAFARKAGMQQAVKAEAQKNSPEAIKQKSREINKAWREKMRGMNEGIETN